MNNQDICHKFFYDEDGYYMPSYKSVGYNNNRFYSYSTVIGKITKTIEGETVALISDDNFSVSTAKHLSYLRSACPFSVYYLPQTFGDSDFYPSKVIDNIKKALEWSKDKLSKKDNREYFSNNYSMLKNTLELVDFKLYFKEIRALLRKYKKTFDDLNNPEKIKEIQKVNRERLRKEREKLEKKLASLTKGKSITEIARLAYSGDGDLDYDTCRNLKKYLDPNKNLSFVWCAGDYIRTSQHISMKLETVKPALILWNKGLIKHGMKLDGYTIMEVTKDFVKIGCHKIPVENLQALYSDIMEK